MDLSRRSQTLWTSKDMGAHVHVPDPLGACNTRSCNGFNAPVGQVPDHARGGGRVPDVPADRMQLTATRIWTYLVEPTDPDLQID